MRGGLVRVIVAAAIIGLLVYTHDDGRGRGSKVPELALAYHRSKLDTMMPELRFSGTPFDQVVEILRGKSGAKLVVAWRALERAGVARDVPLTLQLYEKPLWQGLDQILLRVGGTVILDFTPCEGGEVLVTTREAVNRIPLVARLYDVRDLVEEPMITRVPGAPRGVGRPEVKPIERLCWLVRATVGTEGWDTGNILNEVVPIGGHLLVLQTWENQIKIESTLLKLRNTVGATLPKDAAGP